MADVVDKILGGESVTKKEVPTGPEPKSPDITPRADQRIQELIAERETLKRQYFEETGQLKSELESLKARVESQDSRKSDGDTPVSSWSDLSDTQLRSVMKESLDNPDMQAAAMEELSRRMAQKEVSKFKERHEADQAKSAYRSQVQQQIVADFGQDAADKSSDLYKKADAHYAQLRQAYRQMYGTQQGDTMLASNPEAEYACFAKASGAIRAPDREELARLRGEVEKFKQVGSMELSRATAAMPPDGVKEALASGDWRGALKKLPIIPA